MRGRRERVVERQGEEEEREMVQRQGGVWEKQGGKADL